MNLHDENREAARNLVQAERILRRNVGDVWSLCILARCINGPNPILQAEAQRIVEEVYHRQSGRGCAASPEGPQAA